MVKLTPWERYAGALQSEHEEAWSERQLTTGELLQEEMEKADNFFETVGPPPKKKTKRKKK